MKSTEINEMNERGEKQPLYSLIYKHFSKRKTVKKKG